MSITGDPCLSSLLEILGNEVRFLSAVKQEMEEMQIKLRLMNSFLEDADRLDANAQPRQHRQLVSQIREQTLDAEDVVESYLAQLELRKRNGIFNKFKRYAFFIKEKIDMHKVGSKIKAIKARLEMLEASLQTNRMSRDPRPGEASSSSEGRWQRQRLRQTFGHIIDPNIVGLDEKMEDVVGLLLREQKPCRVVSIYGMGGLGKTTLAKKVYHNDTIRSHFDKLAWVSVSQQFKQRDIWKKIYIVLTSPSLEQLEEITRLQDDELASKLYQVQKDHKCFLVLDDIWSIGDWNSLSPAFLMEESTSGSKILFTTRKKELAEHVDQSGSYGGLEPLSPDQSWELLQKIAFAGRDDIRANESMERLGKEMIEHCGGLPLAIIVLAGILATKENLRDWQTVHDNIRTYLRRGKSSNDEQCLGVDGVLSLSYYDLPHQLKSCFLYLSQFPEDHEIQTNRLLKMWVAEGFVSIQNDRYGEESIEDLAERYLNELVGRCMIQVGIEGSTGRIRAFCMHDLMREMCLSKAKEENFIQSSSPGIEANTVGRVRRLSLFSDRDDDMFYCPRNHQLRSLILYGVRGVTITNFKLLRMLTLERVDIRGKKVSKEIGNLIQLKYLSLRESYVSCLPSMEKLGCLETLDLRVERSCVLNANQIWKMRNLRHLYLPDDCDMYSTRRRKKVQLMGMNMESVQTLVNFPPPNCPLSEIVNFPNLRKLQIRRPKNQREFGQIFRPDDNHKKVEFRRLSSFSVLAGEDGVFERIDLEGILMGCPNVYKLRIRGRLVNFPPEVNQLATKLTKLILEESEIEDPKHIETNLGKLPNLKILHLECDAFMGRELCFQQGCFPQLKSLRLENLWNLEEWRVEEGAMPILQSLEIHYCNKLEMVPEGLKFIATLKELYIIAMPGNFNERVKEGGPDFDKVQHIPTILIENI